MTMKHCAPRSSTANNPRGRAHVLGFPGKEAEVVGIKDCQKRDLSVQCAYEIDL